VTKMPMDTCIHTRKIITCSVLIDSYLHHVYVHAKDYFTKRQSGPDTWIRSPYILWATWTSLLRIYVGVTHDDTTKY
jgi:hypothetical protein